jgi:hypothetical protein
MSIPYFEIHADPSSGYHVLVDGGREAVEYGDVIGLTDLADVLAGATLVWQYRSGPSGQYLAGTPDSATVADNGPSRAEKALDFLSAATDVTISERSGPADGGEPRWLVTWQQRVDNGWDECLDAYGRGATLLDAIEDAADSVPEPEHGPYLPVLGASDCTYIFDGTDGDGTDWYRCLTHNDLSIGHDAPCAAYMDAQPLQSNPQQKEV